MHIIKKLFQARAGQFGPGPEMAFSVVVAVLEGKKIHKFKMKDTGCEYWLDAKRALEVFTRQKYKSRRGVWCIVIPLSFCQAAKSKIEEVKSNG